MDAPSEIQRVRLNSRGKTEISGAGWPGELMDFMKIILQLMRSLFDIYIYIIYTYTHISYTYTYIYILYYIDYIYWGLPKPW